MVRLPGEGRGLVSLATAANQLPEYLNRLIPILFRGNLRTILLPKSFQPHPTILIQSTYPKPHLRDLRDVFDWMMFFYGDDVFLRNNMMFFYGINLCVFDWIMFILQRFLLNYTDIIDFYCKPT